jgi:hypothetical protein
LKGKFFHTKLLGGDRTLLVSGKKIAAANKPIVAGRVILTAGGVIPALAKLPFWMKNYSREYNFPVASRSFSFSLQNVEQVKVIYVFEKRVEFVW